MMFTSDGANLFGVSVHRGNPVKLEKEWREGEGEGEGKGRGKKRKEKNIT